MSSSAAPASIRRELIDLAAEYPRALGHPEQKARFLAGLTSPSLTKARLESHRMFARLSQTSFRVPHSGYRVTPLEKLLTLRSPSLRANDGSGYWLFTA